MNKSIWQNFAFVQVSTSGEEQKCGHLPPRNTNMTIFRRIMEQIKFMDRGYYCIPLSGDVQYMVDKKLLLAKDAEVPRSLTHIWGMINTMMRLKLSQEMANKFVEEILLPLSHENIEKILENRLREKQHKLLGIWMRGG